MPELVHALTSSQIDDLVALYQGEWWSVGRTRADVDTMLAHCIPFGLADDAGRLVGFARAISDRVYKALVLDVIVATAWRGRGLGAQLIDAVVAHPALREVRHIELYCQPELGPFYERWSFSAEVGPVQLMRRAR
jgi:predicted GNAT family N-acyltransferase